MKKLIKHISVLFFAVFAYPGNIAVAQEEVHHKPEIHSYGVHRITGIMGNAFLDNSFSDQSNEILIVPALGLNYDYIFRKGWGLGLHSDILLQQFKAESHGDENEIAHKCMYGMKTCRLQKDTQSPPVLKTLPYPVYLSVKVICSRTEEVFRWYFCLE